MIGAAIKTAVLLRNGAQKGRTLNKSVEIIL